MFKKLFYCFDILVQLKNLKLLEMNFYGMNLLFRMNINKGLLFVNSFQFVFIVEYV